MKKTPEIVALVFVLAIALWLGAFLLRDKSELFCKMSFGEYREIPSSIYTGDMRPGPHACINSTLVKFFWN